MMPMPKSVRTRIVLSLAVFMPASPLMAGPVVDFEDIEPQAVASFVSRGFRLELAEVGRTMLVMSADVPGSSRNGTQTLFNNRNSPLIVSEADGGIFDLIAFDLGEGNPDISATQLFVSAIHSDGEVTEFVVQLDLIVPSFETVEIQALTDLVSVTFVSDVSTGFSLDNIVIVPEPSSVLLVLAGVGAVLLRRRKHAILVMLGAVCLLAPGLPTAHAGPVTVIDFEDVEPGRSSSFVSAGFQFDGDPSLQVLSAGSGNASINGTQTLFTNSSEPVLLTSVDGELFDLLAFDLGEGNADIPATQLFLTAVRSDGAVSELTIGLDLIEPDFETVTFDGLTDLARVTFVSDVSTGFSLDNIVIVPEPSSLLLILAGVGAALLRRRKHALLVILGAVCLLAPGLPTAHAGPITVIDFEDVEPGFSSSFVSSGFQFDGGRFLHVLPASGGDASINGTQTLFARDNEPVVLTSVDGELFDLLAFDVGEGNADVGAEATQLFLTAIHSNGSVSERLIRLDLIVPDFETATFDNLDGLVSVSFVSDSRFGFSLDNIVVVPEPSSVLLVLAGVGALLLRRRRRAFLP